jgi:hypothetical protein
VLKFASNPAFHGGFTPVLVEHFEVLLARFFDRLEQLTMTLTPGVQLADPLAGRAIG